MFLKLIKNFYLKKLLKKRLLIPLNEVNNQKISTIGLLIDCTHFDEYNQLIKEIKSKIEHSVLIDVMLFKDNFSKKDTFSMPFFSYNDIKNTGEIVKPELQEFIIGKYDLFISYYQLEKPILEWVTCLSKANFKTGFGTVNQNLNHFIININANKYKDFTQELINYLKILKKI